MAKRVRTKIGDIFFVELDNGHRKYFQYIANDLTQLNSDVIRVFKKEFSNTVKVDFTELLSGEIDFHAHTMINIGVKLNFFHQDGSATVSPDVDKILFRDTNDYGKKVDEEPVRVSNKWYIWRINDENFTRVGKLEGENRQAEIGVVIPPYAIVDRIKTGRFHFSYPDYE